MDNTLTTKFSLNQGWLTEKDAVVFGVFEGEEIPCGLGFKKETAEKEAELLFPIFSKIKRYFAHKDFSGKLGKVAVIYPENVLYKRVILCGLGKKEELDAEKLRQVASQAIAAAEATDAAKISFTLFGSPLQRAEDRLRYIFEGAVLTLYKFNAYKSKGAEKESGAKITEVEFLLPEIIEADEVSAWQKQLERNVTIAEAVYFARNIVNQPSSVVTPQFLAETAEALAKQYPGISVRVMRKTELKDRGMNGILTVGGGSDKEPVLITLEYSPASASEKTVALVGKGVCFDSGGLSLKSAENMMEMKMDMAGAAAVMGAIVTAARLQLPVKVSAVIPAVENVPSPTAYKPGDIITSASGKTIEVLNTDAEGRIILADALHYAAAELKPTYVIDLATLTYACELALGNHYAGLLGNNDELLGLITEASERTGEKVWLFPFDDCYKKQIESDVADVKNIGGKTAGVITSSLFLKEFVGEHKGYAHIDIAGTAILSEKNHYRPKGGSGFGVRLLVDFLEHLGGVSEAIKAE
ncbi:leucyl aminopeptidase [Candidatus Azambacteria bacterium]|nr:leucyl aminopeptidase [Candidatus Azambacteria bacterium]